MLIPKKAGKGQVARGGAAAMFAGDDVVDLKGERAVEPN